MDEDFARLRPLPGALEFLRELRALTQVIILSDTFEEFAKPLTKRFCIPNQIPNNRCRK